MKRRIFFGPFCPPPFPQLNSSLTGLVDLHTKLVPIALNVSQPLNGVNGTPMREKVKRTCTFSLFTHLHLNIIRVINAINVKTLKCCYFINVIANVNTFINLLLRYDASSNHHPSCEQSNPELHYPCGLAQRPVWADLWLKARPIGPAHPGIYPPPLSGQSKSPAGPCLAGPGRIMFAVPRCRAA